ncbi:MAG: phytase [Blastocatellia bacterium]|nr:phytase [Blastocatellia bacterium]
MLTLSTLFIAAALAAQSSSPATPVAAPTASGDPVPVVLDVTASVETAPVSSVGDAADDPAIWVHPTNRSKSLVIGTDKKGGLNVYDLKGRPVQSVRDGRMNNVDLRDGFRLGGKTVALVTAGNRTDDTLAIYALDHKTRMLTNVAARPIKTATAYGSCMYLSAKTGKYFYFLANKVGFVEQWELFDDGTGKVDAKKVRDFTVGGQLEGCVADDDLGVLYVGEEEVGVWKYPAEPDGGTQGHSVARAGAILVPDVEGISIAKTGPGRGFVIVSSQGNNTYAIFRREGENDYVRSFRIADGGGIDGTSDTDGIDVTTVGLGWKFRHGLLVVQDGTNDGSNQNFKYVRLDRVLTGKERK